MTDRSSPTTSDTASVSVRPRQMRASWPPLISTVLANGVEGANVGARVHHAHDGLALVVEREALCRSCQQGRRAARQEQQQRLTLGDRRRHLECGAAGGEAPLVRQWMATVEPRHAGRQPRADGCRLPAVAARDAPSRTPRPSRRRPCRPHNVQWTSEGLVRGGARSAARCATPASAWRMPARLEAGSP